TPTLPLSRQTKTALPVHSSAHRSSARTASACQISRGPLSVSIPFPAPSALDPNHSSPQTFWPSLYFLAPVLASTPSSPSPASPALPPGPERPSTLPSSLAPPHTASAHTERCSTSQPAAPADAR